MGNDARATMVIDELTTKSPALTTCIAVQHAGYMAETFNRGGIAGH
ncbi:hypothetical protein [Arthrobacter sp. NPDC056727]